LKESRAIKLLKKLPLLKELSDELWGKLTPLITFEDIAEGGTLFNTGEQSQNLYMVIDGELGLYMPCSISGETFYLQSRRKGDTAGDFAVLNAGDHLVSAIAIRKTCVAKFPRHAFEHLTEIESGILAHVYDVAADLSRRVTLAGAYLNLFGDLTHATMDALLEQTQIRHYRTGEVLFEQGDRPDGLYVVVSGKLIVETMSQDGKPHLMALVHANETVGELALLAESGRSATCTAARESTMAFLSREAFEDIIAPRAELLMQLSRLTRSLPNGLMIRKTVSNPWCMSRTKNGHPGHNAALTEQIASSSLPTQPREIATKFATLKKSWIKYSANPESDPEWTLCFCTRQILYSH